MKYLNFFILSCLVLLSYISSSYGFLNSKDWCLPQNKYQRNIPFHKLEDGNKCPSNTYSITDKRALKILLFDYGGYINKIIESGDICNDTYKNYSYLRALIKDKKNLDCKKILQNLADKKVKEALNIALAQKKVEEEARKKTLAEKKAEEEAKIRALAEKLAKEEIARQLKVKQKEEEAKQKALATKKAKEDAARKKALAKKKAEKLAKQKAIAAKKAKEDKARKKALAKEKAEELAKQKAIAAKKAEEEELKQRVLNEKIQKIKDEAKFVVATLKEYVTTDTNKLDILEVSELLENYNNEMQKGWTDTTVEKYEELYDYVQKDEGFIEFSADKKSKQLAAYNEEIIQLREYLTTSQSDLKAFITKNLGSNNAKKALKLAKETKQILKDFEVSQAMTLKNNISTWKAMNGVAENKQETKNNTSKVILVEKKVEKKKDSLNLKPKSIDTLEPPPAQKNFLNIVVKAQSSAISATNDMQRGGFLSTRSRKLCDLLRTIDFSPNNWIGTIDDVNSNSDGKGVLSIKLATDIFLKTWNNSFSDIGANTLLEPNSPIFIAVAEMAKGDKVKFSGNFFTRKTHCISERSVTLKGKISEPEFTFKFTEVYKIKKKTQISQPKKKLTTSKNIENVNTIPKFENKKEDFKSKCTDVYFKNKQMSLAFCSGFTDFFLASGGIKKGDPRRLTMNRADYLKIYEKIDKYCGYNKSYTTNFKDEYSSASLDHSINITAYASNRSTKNLRKIQNPVHSKPCFKLIKFHKQDIKNNL